MRVINTIFPEVKLLVPEVFEDYRGFFMESFSLRKLKDAGVEFTPVQENHSLSKKAGTLRGLHYQLNPMAQSKLVRVIKGAIYDVVVDIRKGSPTYGKWAGFILTEYNKYQILVPKGFAHGVLTLVDNTEILYLVDEFYSKEHDRAIRWNDPEIGIQWFVENPILSEKDANAPLLRDAENNFVYGE